MSLPKAFLTNFSNVTVSPFSLFSVCLSLLFLSSDSEGMWSFSQDLTAILVKQEPSLMSENCPDTSPPLANTSTCSHPLTLAPPPQRNHTGEKVKHGHYTSNLENRHLEWNTCILSQEDVILVWISIDVIELMMVNLTHTAHQRDHCISMTMKNMRTNVLRVLFAHLAACSTSLPSEHVHSVSASVRSWTYWSMGIGSSSISVELRVD